MWWLQIKAMRMDLTTGLEVARHPGGSREVGLMLKQLTLSEGDKVKVVATRGTWR